MKIKINEDFSLNSEEVTAKNRALNPIVINDGFWLEELA